MALCLRKELAVEVVLPPKGSAAERFYPQSWVSPNIADSFLRELANLQKKNIRKYPYGQVLRIVFL